MTKISGQFLISGQFKISGQFLISGQFKMSGISGISGQLGDLDTTLNLGKTGLDTQFFGAILQQQGVFYVMCVTAQDAWTLIRL